MEDFSGPIKKRVQTNFWYIWFIFVLIGIYLIHCYLAIGGGKPERLYHGLDFRALPCGVANLT